MDAKIFQQISSGIDRSQSESKEDSTQTKSPPTDFPQTHHNLQNGSKTKQWAAEFRISSFVVAYRYEDQNSWNLSGVDSSLTPQISNELTELVTWQIGNNSFSRPGRAKSWQYVTITNCSALNASTCIR